MVKAKPDTFSLDQIQHVPFAPEEAREGDIARLLQYWASIRGEAVLPCKDDLDPGQFGPILSAVTILERLASDNFHIRLFATMMTERYGRDATGENHIETLPKSLREPTQLMYADCLDTPSAWLLHLKLKKQEGLTLEAEVANLPLADRNGEAKFILTANRSPGGPGSSGRLVDSFDGDWTNIETLGVKRLQLI